MPTIGQFVNALANDDDLAKQFDQFPIRTAKAFEVDGKKLTQAQINKIMTGDIISLRKQIETDLNKKPLVFRVKRG